MWILGVSGGRKEKTVINRASEAQQVILEEGILGGSASQAQQVIK